MLINKVIHFRECLLPYSRLQLALPYRHHAPSHRLESFAIFLVAYLIVLYLSAPELRVRLGEMRVPMPVPEAAMDEDDDAVLAHHDVGRTRQSAAVLAVPVPSSEEITAHNHLRFRILAADMRHTAVACLSVEDIHSSSFLFFRKDTE